MKNERKMSKGWKPPICSDGTWLFLTFVQWLLNAIYIKNRNWYVGSPLVTKLPKLNLWIHDPACIYVYISSFLLYALLRKKEKEKIITLFLTVRTTVDGALVRNRYVWIFLDLRKLRKSSWCSILKIAYHRNRENYVTKILIFSSGRKITLLNRWIYKHGI